MVKKNEHQEILERLSHTVAVLDGLIESLESDYEKLDFLQYAMAKEQIGADYEVEIAPERYAWSWVLEQVRERMKWYLESAY
jgi:hypothetical protein